jgi:hypothetical protein
MITIEQMVQREVNVCLSHLVSTLAQGIGIAPHRKQNAFPLELGDLIEQAFELASPIDDWEESAIQAGWRKVAENSGYEAWQKGENGDTAEFAIGAQDACYGDGLEPYQREVYEHWAVSPWLAEKLKAHGEKVDDDFAGMNVWARTTTGQGIASDGVIERIYADMIAA